MCGITGVFAPRTRCSTPRVLRAVCAAASRTGIGRYRGGRRRHDPIAQRDGSARRHLRRRDPQRAQRSHRDRPHALLDDRFVDRRQRAAAARTHRARRFRLRAQRQPDQHRRAARVALADDGAAGNLRFRSHGEADRRVERLDDRSHRVGAGPARAARTRSSSARKTSSTRFAIRGACGRCASVRSADGGYVVASESCALGTVGAQYVREIERGEIVRIDCSRTWSRVARRRRRRRSRRSACSNTSTSRAPTRG